MTKKQYTTPQMDTVVVSTCSMVCTSLGITGNASEYGVTTADSRMFEDTDF